MVVLAWVWIAGAVRAAPARPMPALLRNFRLLLITHSIEGRYLEYTASGSHSAICGKYITRASATIITATKGRMEA